MPHDVIARVTRVTTQLQFAEKHLEVDFPGDVLYRIEVPDEYVENEEGAIVFNRDGIRHILKELSVVLVVDSDRVQQSDF